MDEYNVKNNNELSYHNFDSWREIRYYEYIREHIIKQKVSPNFVTMYGYYVCEKCDIDFDKIANIKGNKIEKQDKYIKEYEENKKIVNMEENVINTLNTINPSNNNLKPIDVNFNNKQIGGNAIEALQVRDLMKQNPDLKTPPFITYKINGKSTSGKGIVALTESPNYNLYSWASRTYESEGNVKRMINTGYHKSEVWQSILFQLMAALYVMQIHCVQFTKFSIMDNVYIKDISTHGNITRYWKYLINGVEYYIPNHGYLLMIDSNYKDMEQGNFTLGKSDNKKCYKIYGNLFRDDDKDCPENSVIKKMVFSAFKNVFNSNTFSKAFTNMGGTPPPEEINSLLDKIYQDASTTDNIDISRFIYKYMGKFLNNRVGTLLKENEKKNVRRDERKDFNNGQILVHEVQNDTYKFVVYLGESKQSQTINETTGNLVSVITENSSINDIPMSSLFNYSSYEKIIQDFRANESNLSEEDLLEVYTISKN
jgi:hypothetical protein